MGTRITKETVTTVASGEKDPELEAGSTDELTSEEEELQLALAEVGDTEVKIQVIRTLPADKAGNCTSYPAAEFSIDRLREEWGGGKYMLYFRLPGGKLKTKRSISVLEKLKPPTPPDRTAELIAAMQSNKGGDNGALLTAILGMMQAQQKSTTDMIVAMITAQGQNKAAGMGPTELVAILGAIEGLKGKGGGDKGGSSLDELVKVLKVAKELGGDGDGGGGILDKLATVAGPLLEKLAERTNAPQSAPLPRRPVPVTATIVPHAPTAPAAPNAEGDNGAAPGPLGERIGADNAGEISGAEDGNMNLRLINWLRETLKLLLKQAEKGSDPELYADYVLDNLPEGITADVVLAQLRDPEAMTKLQFFDGRVATHREWLEEFKDATIERIEEAQEEAAKAERRAQRAAQPASPDPDGPAKVLYEAPAGGDNSTGDGM